MITQDDLDRFFVSGSNGIPHMRGLAAAGRNFGVAIDKVSGPAMIALEGLADSGRKVFVDSGAFSEVEFNAPHACGKSRRCREGKCPGAGNLPHPDAAPFQFATAKLITDEQWNERLDRYETIARAYGDRCWLVAPDRVGSQEITLERLRKYAGRIRQLAATRALRGGPANIIVAIQRGKLSATEFDREVRKILGADVDYVRGIPSKKGASSPLEVAVFARYLRSIGARAHLLGKGPHAEDFDAFCAALDGVDFTTDAVRLRALVGWGNDGKSPRAHTAALVAAKHELGDADPSAATELAVRRTFEDETRRVLAA